MPFMLKEVLPQTVDKVVGATSGETFSPENWSNEAKVIATLSTIAIQAYITWFTSRRLEGTVDRKFEKATVVVGTIAITAANALANHQIWT